MSTSRTRMPRYRLKMDLSEFYEDQRRLAYILVDPKWELVRRLQEHVQALFNVQSVYFVTDDGVYIPSQESIDIIKTTDTLKVIVPHKIKKRKKNDYVFEENGALGDVAVDEFIEEDRGSKLQDDDKLTSSTPNVRATKKQKTDSTASELYMSSGLDGEAVTSTNRISNGEDPAVMETIDLESNEETIKTHKRKRVRKKSKRDISLRLEDKSSRLSQVPVPISSSTIRQSRSMGSSKQHLHFEENQPNTELITFRCNLSRRDGSKAREIGEECPSGSNVKSASPRIEIQENILLVKGADEANNEASVIEIEDSLVTTEGIENATLTYDDVQSLTVPLSGFPTIGEKFMFRMIKPNGSRPPEVSDFMCARCEDVNPAKMSVTCLLLGGSENFDGIRPGNGDETEPNQNRVELRLDELVDKRIFRI